LATSRKAKEIFQSGRLGKIKNVSFSGQHCIDYAHRPTWYFEKGKHGGTINDLAIHGIDLLRDIAGLEITSIDGVRNWNAYAIHHPDFKDSAVFMARLTGDAELLADVSYSGPSQVFSMPTYWNFKFWCEKGMLTFCLIDGNVYIYEEGKEVCQTEAGIPTTDTCLSDLIQEIQTNANALTESVIASTRSALWVQSVADQEV
jgi:predicted dehydrogenase